MNYHVDWTRRARQELAALWMKSRDRSQVARSANYIERLLMIDPIHEGIAMGRGIRRLYVTPLLVDFKVDATNQKVTMLRVR